MRVAGHNVIGIVAAGAAFWFLGALWYGFLFQEPWMAGAGLTEADFEGDNLAWMGLGVVIAFVSAIGLSIVLRWGGDMPAIGEAVKKTLLVWVGFGLTAALYQLAYWPEHSLLLFAVMGGYTLVGWLIAAAILAALK